ncbi:hypothetical protein PSE10B_55630 [Pseudomonas amygdali pv. eriobotryae]|nr:helix-turn-helix transcriptional regulator [Pseudomonas amygdali]GFZ69041.1 hypothetical protein PSE10B_55630 [Pseudomonas amygdali pv. eriobotryae]
MTITPELLMKIRKVYRLTQAKLGELLGVTDEYINMIERGKCPVSKRLEGRITYTFQLNAEKVDEIESVYKRYSID